MQENPKNLGVLRQARVLSMPHPTPLQLGTSLVCLSVTPMVSPIRPSIALYTTRLHRRDCKGNPGGGGGLQLNFAQLPVYFIFTGETKRLSAPMSLESLYTQGKAMNSGGGDGKPHLDMVLTRLEAAVESVQELEKGEESAFGIFPDSDLFPTRSGTGLVKLRSLDTSRWPLWTGHRKMLYNTPQFLTMTRAQSLREGGQYGCTTKPISTPM